MVHRYDPDIGMSFANDGDFVTYEEYEKLVKHIKHIDLCLDMMQTDIDCNVPLSLQRIRAYIEESGESK